MYGRKRTDLELILFIYRGLDAIRDFCFQINIKCVKDFELLTRIANSICGLFDFDCPFP